MNKVLRLYHTVKHLKVRQIAGRLHNRLRSKLENPARVSSQTVLAFPGCRWPLDVDILPPVMQINIAKSILEGNFFFIGNKVNVGFPPRWECPDMPKLWQYNLHYLKWIWALSYGDAKHATLDWIENHKLASNATGWESYPISVRLMNICGVFLGRYRKQTEEDKVFLDKLWSSIYIQTQWLTRHLETHLLGNHLFENGAALAFVGSCFSCTAADKWLQAGIHILDKEIPEQILNDGMHFELTPMYHCRITYLLAMLFNTGHPKLEDLTRKPLERMVTALRHMTHPDGQVALLNDSAFGIYNTPDQLFSYVRNFFEIDNVSLGNFALPEAGYYGFRDDKGTYVICDAARIGPDYIPGHAHADMFSFELSLKGHRVIVDSGVYDYEANQMRQYCRSTKAHNTLEINGQDQCEMWGVFRVARRGRPHNIKWMPSKDGFQLSGWHDGYKRLKANPIHYREFNWNKSGKLTIKDITNAPKTQNVISRLHLHPNCEIDRLKDSTVRVAYPEGDFRIIFSRNGRLSLEDSYYCPEFGVKIANKALAFSFSGRKTETEFQIDII